MQHYSNFSVVQNSSIWKVLRFFLKAPSEGRYNKAAVRALPVETSIETVSTGKYPREGGSEI